MLESQASADRSVFVARSTVLTMYKTPFRQLGRRSRKKFRVCVVGIRSILIECVENSRIRGVARPRNDRLVVINDWCDKI